MKKKSNKLIWVIVILLILFGTMIYVYINPTSSTVNANNDSSDGTTNEAIVSTQTITKSISSSRRNYFSCNRKLGIEY